MVDVFCNAINKRIKKRKREFYKNKYKEQTQDTQRSKPMEQRTMTDEHDAETEEDFIRFDIIYKKC